MVSYMTPNCLIVPVYNLGIYSKSVVICGVAGAVDRVDTDEAHFASFVSTFLSKCT